MKTKTCSRCKETKDIKEWNKNKKRYDGLQSFCRACTKELNNESYANSPKRRKSIREGAKRTKLKNKIFVFNYLKEHPCVDCGESDPFVLDFDHVSGSKKFSIGYGKVFYTLKKVKEEIKKCEVRCANCHRRKTAHQFGYYKWVE